MAYLLSFPESPEIAVSNRSVHQLERRLNPYYCMRYSGGRLPMWREVGRELHSLWSSCAIDGNESFLFVLGAKCAVVLVEIDARLVQVLTHIRTVCHTSH